MAAGTRSRHQRPGRLSTARTERKSYRELSTSSESDGSDDSTTEYQTPVRRSRRSRDGAKPSIRSQLPQLAAKKRKAPSILPSCSSNKKLRTERRGTEDNDKSAMQVDLESGRVPAWHTLPYHILVQIFHYVARPLTEEVQLSPSSITWLLHTARVCKAFSEPAISVLYYSPPLDPSYRAHGLLAHLQGQNDHSMFNYRAKVKYLDIQVSFTLCRRYQGRYLELGELLAVVPQLRGLGLHRVEDILKATAMIGEPVTSKGVRALQDAIKALQDYRPLLREWKWNAVASSRRKLFDISKIHRTSSFQNLRRLTFAHFDAKDRYEKYPENPEQGTNSHTLILARER